MQMTPVKEKALEHGLEVWQPVKLRTSDVAEKLEALQPDFIVVVAFGQIIPKNIPDIPKFGCINVHASFCRSTAGRHRSSGQSSTGKKRAV